MVAKKILVIAGAVIVAILVITLTVLLIVLLRPADITPDSQFCEPLVIAHRGASGYVPEHTLAAYALAVMMGANYVEPDVVMTRDGHLIARHDNELGLTTDVAERSEFADRYRTQTVDGSSITGWFTEDFTLAEIKTLRAIERIPNIRPGNARMDGALEVATMQEIIDLVKSLEVSEGRTIGIYPEIKHSSHFQLLGLGMERPLVDMLHNNGYKEAYDPIYIQSFEITNLRELKNMTNLRLIQLYGSRTSRPYDQALLGNGVTYGDMATVVGLQQVSTYAYAVGPEKNYIIPRTDEDRLGEATTFVNDAHLVGLKVHPYTFRSENPYLPLEFRTSDMAVDSIGNVTGELEAFFATGIDGLFTDQPDVPVRMKGPCPTV